MNEPGDVPATDIPARETHRLVVDRFEGELAVVQVNGGRLLDLPRWLLPPDTREGDVVEVTRIARAGSAGLQVHVDRAATDRAEERARQLLEELKNKDPGGDLGLT